MALRSLLKPGGVVNVVGSLGHLRSMAVTAEQIKQQLEQKLKTTEVVCSSHPRSHTWYEHLMIFT